MAINQNEFEALKREVAELRVFKDFIFHGDRFRFTRPVDFVEMKFGSESSKMSFFGSKPISAFGDPTGRQDTSGSSGISMTTGHRFNGNIGTDFYSVGDIVYALKQYGLFKNE